MDDLGNLSKHLHTCCIASEPRRTYAASERYSEKIVEKVVARRGRLHAFESIDPRRTALVVIDLDHATVGSNEECRRVVPRVNEVAAAVRRAGGTVAWVRSHMPVMPKHSAAILGAQLAAKYFRDGQPGGDGTALWHELHASPDDLVAVKSGASAFFPGKCNLKEQLDPLGVDTPLIAGAVTNICCESSARDAVELEYRVILVSDALSGHAHGLHEATLATFYRIFGDVRPSGEIIDLLRRGPSENEGHSPAAGRRTEERRSEEPL